MLIKYQTNTTAVMLSTVVKACGSISAHAVAHVPRQKNCSGTQLLHSTPVYLHACAALCARRVRERARECGCVCAWFAGHLNDFTCVRAFSHGDARYLASHAKSGPPLQCPASHFQNRVMSPWQIAASGQAKRSRRSVAGEARWVGGHLEAPRGLKTLLETPRRLRNLQDRWIRCVGW